MQNQIVKRKFRVSFVLSRQGRVTDYEIVARETVFSESVEGEWERNRDPARSQYPFKNVAAPRK